jgi:hypothetical protein
MNTDTDSYTEEQLTALINEYIESLNDIEKIVLTIAQEHLESSFCIEKSVGFTKWLREKKVD